MVMYDKTKLTELLSSVLHSNTHPADLSTFLDNLLADQYVNTNVPFMAYIIATAYWETDTTMRPIIEVHQIKVDTPTRQRVRASQDKYWDTGFYGRGYVQLTWRTNYVNMSTHLHSEYTPTYIKYSPYFLVDNPELAAAPSIAYDILSSGMRGGYFSGTGRGLSYYLSSSPPDYFNARRTVNGTDQAQTIAQYASTFAKLITQAAI